MKYLLDTCFLSELRKPQPNKGVIDWLNQVNEQNLYISSVSICEIQKGISQLNDPVYQQNLIYWLDNTLLPWFNNKIIPVDSKLARHWGELLGTFSKKGLTRPIMDTLIAASVIHGEFILVTRNTNDFKLFEMKLYNPWNE